MVAHLPELSRGPTMPQMAIQRVGLLLTKAGLSSIPFAALVFDLGQAAVDIANAKVLDHYLEELGQRIASLDDATRRRLEIDPLHQIAGQGCLRSLLSESNERVAQTLARAVAELAQLSAPDFQRAECARILNAIDEPMLHCLQTYHRFEVGSLGGEEQEIANRVPKQQRHNRRNHLGLILLEGMPLLSWPSVVDSVMQRGLIQHILDGGEIEELPEAITVAPVTPLGHRILQLCFEDPTRSAFGEFASI